MDKPVHFLFYSRLEKEKGIDLLLGAMKYFAEIGEKRCRVSIFSDGSWRKEVEQFAKLYPNFPMTYYGRQPKRDIFSFMKREKVDIVLMPSIFLETFGLNSGEALRHGIPVLGFNKGGTKQFLLDSSWAIESYEGKNDQERLISAMKKFLGTFALENCLHIRQVAQQCALRYSRPQWKANFEALLSSLKIENSNKRILIVSDYENIVGGIEAYMYEVKEVLKEDGYIVEIFGGGLTNRRARKLGLVATAANFRSAVLLLRKIREFQPDIIYRNSVHRYLGRLPFWLGSKKVAHNFVMYHDFGLFHPFPSAVYNEEQLIFEPSFSGFFRASGKTFVRMPLLRAKYLSLRILRGCLKRHIDVHLVPSEYMVDLVARFYEGKTDVRALPNMIA